jgi:hypothetical protein
MQNGDHCDFMIDVRLLPTQRAQLFQAVQQAGFDPADFDVTTLPLRLARTVVFSPGQASPQGNQIVENWPGQLICR